MKLKRREAEPDRVSVSRTRQVLLELLVGVARRLAQASTMSEAQAVLVRTVGELVKEIDKEAP